MFSIKFKLKFDCYPYSRQANDYKHEEYPIDHDL